MKKVITLTMIFLSGFVLFPLVVTAYPISEGDELNLAEGKGTAGVGEIIASNKSFVFSTFRLETGPITLTAPDNSYKISAIKKDLDERIAYLYYHYSVNDLDRLSEQFSSGNGAADLQQAIWFLQGVQGVQANYLVKLAISATSGSTPSWDGLGPVRVMEVQNAQGTYEMLVMVVPESDTLMLVVAGVVGLAFAGALYRRTTMKGPKAY